MLHFTHLFTYVAIVSVFVIVPGPSVLLTVAKSIASGTRAGLMTALGIAMGDVVHTTLAVFGVSALLMAWSCLTGLRVNEAGDQAPQGATFEQKVGLLRQDLAPPPALGAIPALFSDLGQTETGRLEGESPLRSGLRPGWDPNQ